MSARNGLAGRRSGRFAHSPADQRVRPRHRGMCAKNLSPIHARAALSPPPTPHYFASMCTQPPPPSPDHYIYIYMHARICIYVCTPGDIYRHAENEHEGFINNNQNGTAAHTRAHIMANSKLYTASPLFQ